MLKSEVTINGTYLAKISGRVVPVVLRSISPYGGWNARNLITGRDVRIKSAAKLRRSLNQQEVDRYLSIGQPPHVTV